MQIKIVNMNSINSKARDQVMTFFLKSFDKTIERTVKFGQLQGLTKDQTLVMMRAILEALEKRGK